MDGPLPVRNLGHPSVVFVFQLLRNNRQQLLICANLPHFFEKPTPNGHQSTFRPTTNCTFEIKKISYPLKFSNPPTDSGQLMQRTSFFTHHHATPHLLLEEGKAGSEIRSKGGCTPPPSGCAQPPLPVKNTLGTARMKKDFSNFRLTQFGGL